MKVKLEQINQFLKAQTIAIAGMSENKKKFGYQEFDEMVKF